MADNTEVSDEGAQLLEADQKQELQEQKDLQQQQQQQQQQQKPAAPSSPSKSREATAQSGKPRHEGSNRRAFTVAVLSIVSLVVFVFVRLGYSINDVPRLIEEAKSSARFKEIAGYVLTSWVACWSVHFGSTALLSTLGLDFSKYTHHERVHIANRVVSSCHGIGVGVYSFYAVLIAQYWDKDTVNAYPKGCDYMFSGMLGYQIYDFGAELWGGITPPELWVHHGLASLGCALEMAFRLGAFYPVVFGITELTVIPANILFWMQTFKTNETHPIAYTVNLGVWMLMFFVLRTFLGPITVYYAHVRNQVGVLLNMSGVVPVFICINVLVLSLLNVYWTRNVVNKFIRQLARVTKGGKASKKDD